MGDVAGKGAAAAAEAEAAAGGAAASRDERGGEVGDVSRAVLAEEAVASLWVLLLELKLALTFRPAALALLRKAM